MEVKFKDVKLRNIIGKHSLFKRKRLVRYAVFIIPAVIWTTMLLIIAVAGGFNELLKDYRWIWGIVGFHLIPVIVFMWIDGIVWFYYELRYENNLNRILLLISLLSAVISVVARCTRQ